MKFFHFKPSYMKFSSFFLNTYEYFKSKAKYRKNNYNYARGWNTSQSTLLEKIFEKNNYIDSDARRILAYDLGVHQNKIYKWFINRRFKARVKNLFSFVPKNVIIESIFFHLHRSSR